MRAFRHDTPLVTIPALCVLARGGNCGPSVCERVCPTAAIHIEPVDSTAPGPKIDEGSCELCHLCVSACPSGAFRDGGLATKLEATIRRRLANTRQLVLRCAGRHTAEQSRSEVEDITEDAEGIVVPCVGVVSPSFLILASACGAESVVLDTRLCSGCRWRRGTVLARRAARQSQSLLRLFGRNLRVQFMALEPAASRQQRGISRRQFLECLRSDASTVTTVHAAPPTLAYPPLERLMLNRALHRLGAPMTVAGNPGEGSLWTLAATNACDCCGACAALCPTQALQLRETAREATLVALPVLCTGCALCLERCPRQALAWSTPAPPGCYTDGDDVDRLESVTLAHSRRDVCDVCARPIDPWRQGPLCADCHVKQAIATSFATVEGAI